MSSLDIDTSREAAPVLVVAQRIDRGILLTAQIVGLLVMVALFVAVFAGVLLRYLSDHGAAWVNELPYLLFPWLCASGIVIAAQVGAHIVVEFLRHGLPSAKARWLIIGTEALAVGLFGYLAWHGTTLIRITSSEHYPTLGLTTAWAYSALVITCALLAVTALTSIVLALLSQRAPTALRQSPWSESSTAEEALP
ncbi:TRAP transporter small permease [Halomonas huangheensis]|uniref:TRAP transporter small permease protein n=1 Tax=Halomonas huangheensis TaxID=1178482 RepID=W1N9C0_9GAMM|nr:TRAP transporter small permease [Halomonas huangheensis]ALM53891.1 hypothetical protein AR456_17645 [Halomonas huangheensis]ERL52162.1 hypothetical protein BJB45_09355 [Halomonas huangheensis]